MTTGVTKALETISDLKDLALDAVTLVKDAQRGALGWGAVLAGVVRVGSDVKELVADAPDALPELGDGVSADEAGQLAKASYALVVAVLGALKKSA